MIFLVFCSSIYIASCLTVVLFSVDAVVLPSGQVPNTSGANGDFHGESKS